MYDIPQLTRYISNIAMRIIFFIVFTVAVTYIRRSIQQKVNRNFVKNFQIRHREYPGLPR